MNRRKRFHTCLQCGTDSGRNPSYCSLTCQQAHAWARRKAEIVHTGVAKGRRIARRYVIERDGLRCAICGGTEWNSRPIPLILDHIDGNADNWLLTNLRLVCPNCDAQLPTFKNRNKGKGRASRRQRYSAGLSY